VPSKKCSKCGDIFLPGNISLAVYKIADEARQPKKKQVTVLYSDFSNETINEDDLETTVTLPVYAEPVHQLMLIGRPVLSPEEKEWPDYLQQFQLTKTHIPELIRMSTDEILYHLPEDRTEGYANIHAWRALGQLKAIEALTPMLTFLTKPESEFNEWANEDFPVIFAMFGPEALLTLQSFLTESSHSESSRITILSAIQNICQKYQKSRTDGINIIMKQLKKLESSSEGLNGFLVGALIQEKVLEAVPLIEKAYAADCVDELVCGTLEDVLVDIGAQEATEDYLKDKQRRHEEADQLFHELFSRKSTPQRTRAQQHKRLKAQKKKIKLAKRKNRRK
jgi:hypothetical protein